MPALQRAALVAVPVAIRDWGEAFAVAYALDDARTHLVPAAGADLLGWLAATPAGLGRDEIVAKIGRSPDWGTAYVLALTPTPKRAAFAAASRPASANYSPMELARRRNSTGGHTARR